MKKIILSTIFNALLFLPSYAETKIAVMPFEVLSKEPYMQQFGAGTTDTLTNALGSVPDFVMVDRGQLGAILKEQAFQNSGFTDQAQSVKLGKLLNVDLLIIGSIQNEEKNYRITARFTHVETGKILKSVQVTGNSIFTLQDQLAGEIISSQKVNVTDEQKQRIDNITNATNNNIAYDYYTKGRTSYFKFTESGFKEAIDFFDKALTVDNKYTLALASKSEAQALLSYELKKNGIDHLDLLKQAESNALTSISQNSNLAESHRALSIVYNLQRKRKEAQAEAQKAVTLNPNDAEAYVSLWINTKFDAEDPMIHKALTLNPYLVPAYNHLGNAYAIKRKYDDAIQNFQQAIKVNPEYASSYLNLALIYQQQNKIPEALTNFQQAIKINPDYAFAYYHLANFYIEQNNEAQAVVELNNALKINPKFSSALLKLATIYNKQGRYKASLALLKNNIELNKADKDTLKEISLAYQNIGSTYYTEKNYPEAINAYQELLKVNPNDVSALINLGVSYYSTGDINNAVNSYTKAISLNPNNAQAHDNLGIAYQAQSKNTEAMDEYKKACELGNTSTCDWLKNNK